MHTEVLVSKLQSFCQNNRIPWNADEGPVEIANRLRGAGLWKRASRQLRVLFIPKTEQFVDAKDIAQAMAIIGEANVRNEGNGVRQGT